MAFDSLSEKLQNVFRNLRSKGRLTQDDVKAALKEVKLALLEADVNFKVVKNFTKEVQAQAIGSDVMNGLNPGQMVIKIVHDEMVRMMGSETTELAFRQGADCNYDGRLAGCRQDDDDGENCRQAKAKRQKAAFGCV